MENFSKIADFSIIDIEIMDIEIMESENRLKNANK